MLRLFSLMTLGATALASPIESCANKLPRDGPITQQVYDGLKWYVQHAGGAYCNSDKPAGAAIQCGSSCPGVMADKATIVESFSGSDTGIAGYVGIDPARSEIVLAIRGSDNIANWITNIDFPFSDCTYTSGCQVHNGFQRAWNEISVAATAAVKSAAAQYPSYRYVATGHSLGGAVATLAAIELRLSGLTVDLYTYGSPRVGNGKFANFATDQGSGKNYRVTHSDDIVPHLPPIALLYFHVSPEFWLVNGTATQDDYPIQSVQECDGIANLSCNGGKVALDFDAHSHYFQDVHGGCPASYAAVTNLNKAAITPEDEARILRWTVQDQEIVANM